MISLAWLSDDYKIHQLHLHCNSLVLHLGCVLDCFLAGTSDFLESCCHHEDVNQQRQEVTVPIKEIVKHRTSWKKNTFLHVGFGTDYAK